MRRSVRYGDLQQGEVCEHGTSSQCDECVLIFAYVATLKIERDEARADAREMAKTWEKNDMGYCNFCDEYDAYGREKSHAPSCLAMKYAKDGG